MKSSLRQQSFQLSFVEILARMWERKILVLAMALSFCAMGLSYAIFFLNWYSAEVLLKPVDNRNGQTIGSQIGGLGGLAGLAGINLAGSSSAEAVAVLGSNELAESFIGSRNLLPILFAKKWDSATKTWKLKNAKDQPDLRDGARFFEQKIRKVNDDKRTGLVTLSVEWKDPKLAAEWANQLVEEANARMRSRALIESEANVAYLKQELASTSLLTLQQSIGHILDSELQKLMLARGNKDYAFRVIDQAETPKWKAGPQRLIVAFIAMMAGALAATLLIILQDGLRRREASS